ncbi:hypothetical protein HX836_09260 [Pseudomonas yamanorum]|nr:hypothetical protein [Pseudomonas yamanorum]
MSEQPINPTPEGTFNVDLRGVHYDFLKNRVPAWFLGALNRRQEELANHQMELPNWYLNATHQQKADLADSHTRYREALNQVENTLGEIRDVKAFAEQPLKDAIKQRFNLDLDVNNVYFASKYEVNARGDLGGAFVFGQHRGPSQRFEYRGISLLEAALANFVPDEEKASECADCQVITTWSAYDGEIIPSPEAIKGAALAINRHEFAQLCRTLDLGGLYQKHLKAIVQPTDNSQRAALETQLREHQRQLLALSAEVAMHQPEWGISADGYRMIQQVITDPGKATLDGKPVTFAALKVFGSVLVGPLLIGPARLDSDRVERLLVHIPHDPQQPLKEYASSSEFMADLRTRLHGVSYRRFFSRFVPQGDQGRFFRQFNLLYKPANGNGVAGDYPLAATPKRLPIEETGVNGNLWEQLRKAQVRKILADARAVAVPTGDEDQKARIARLEGYVDAVISVFNLAAFVVPGLGPVMLLVGATQMCFEVYEGIEAYERGDVKTMWAHFSSVALNVAMLGVGAKVLPSINTAGMVDNLRPVTLASGKQLLWNPDLSPYKVPIELGADATPDELGLYQHNGQTILALDGDYFRVVQDAETGQHHIRHPTRADAYQPQLGHNHAGVWSHEVDAPLTWDRQTLIRRLGLEQTPLSPERLEQARAASGVEDDVLRQAVVEHEPVPLMLNDTLERFKAHQALTTFVEQMSSAEPAEYAKADPALQLQIMQRHGMLPTDVALRVLASHGRVLWQSEALASWPTRVVVLTDEQLIRGQLLEQVLNTLQGIDPQLKDVPGSALDAQAVRAGKLRQHIADTVDTFKSALIEERYKALTASVDPDVQRVMASHPMLPTSVAEQLLSGLTVEAQQAFHDTGLLPPPRIEQAKWYEQEVRVSRAYEGLHLDTPGNLDSLRLALHSVETLPGWPQGTRMELRQYSATGPLLDAIGSPNAMQVKTLVLREDGLFEAPMPEDVYAAAWDALSVAQRQALAMTDARQLKQVVAASPLPREQLRAVLLANPVRKPAYDPSMRLLGGSGIRKMVADVFSSSRGRAKTRARVLYPTLNEAELTQFIASLAPDPHARLTALELEYRTLQRDLQVWVRANAPQNPVTAYDRAGGWARGFADRIESCWRRKTDTLSLHAGPEQELPVLNADFSHVRALELYGIKWSDTAQAFIKRFTHVKELGIISVGLTELPDVIGEMNNLTLLNLRSNRIRLTPQSAATLGALGNLEELDLSGNALGLTPDFSGMNRLKKLRLSNTQLAQWPTGLQHQTGLQLLDLRYNQLREAPSSHLNPLDDQLEAMARINNVTLLHGNQFPSDYWMKFDRYWKRVDLVRPELMNAEHLDAFDSPNPRLERFRRIYPKKTIAQLKRFIWGASEDDLLKVEREFDTLERQLNAWAFSGGGTSQHYVLTSERGLNFSAADDRFMARQRILQCWRKEGQQVSAFDGTPIGYELDLSGLSLPSLPDLDVDFSHVGSLKLKNMGLNASPEGFLTRFRQVRWLDMSNNRLLALPLALGEMNGLTRLTLNGNQIRLTPTAVGILSGRTTLRALWLYNNPLGLAPDFSLLTDIRTVDLRNTGIDTWPAGLTEHTGINEIYLNNNQITTIPDAVIAPSEANLGRMAQVNNVTDVSNNPLSVATVQQVSAYRARLEQARLATPDNPSRLVATALNSSTRAPVGTASQNPFQRWVLGLPGDQVTLRRAQWRVLQEQEGAAPFFEILQRLDLTKADSSDLRRRVWEVIDSISENTPESQRLRKELFDLAGEPGCCDRAAYSFSNLEVRTLLYKARTQAMDQTLGTQLSELSKGLLRLHEVDKIAAADIQRSEAIVNDPAVSTADKLPHRQRLAEEVEIRLAYRYGLKDRLQLPGQPQHVTFIGMAGVTPTMLDGAYAKVIALDNSAEEFQALLSREFWQDYVTRKYRSQFDAQGEPYQQQLAALHEKQQAQELSATVYKEKADDLHAQLAIKEGELIGRLTRQEIAEMRLPREPLEALVEADAVPGLQLSQARAIEFNKARYFIASMPDAGDGQHYLLWVQNPNNPYELVSSGIVAKPEVAGGWTRRGLAGGGSDSEFEEAVESMAAAPYTSDELRTMRQQIHFTVRQHPPGTYVRANNGKYPLRDLQGRPVRIRKLERSITLESGTHYTSEPIKPYIKFEGYEGVGALYEEKLQVRAFIEQDMQVPQEKSLIGQNMVVANRRIAKGEIVGVYGGTILPTGIFGSEGHTYTMRVGDRPTLKIDVLTSEPIFLSGDNILSRINTVLEYDADGKPLRQAAQGYNVEAVSFEIEADLMLGVGESATPKRKDYTLPVVFATQDIPAGAELRMNYQYSDEMIKTLFT